MDEHGADALRWFMAASGSPWLPRRVGHGALQEIVRKMLLTYWNTASFLTLYADANDWSPADGACPAVAERPALDRWALSEVHRLVQRGDRGARGVRHASGPGGCSRRSSTTCPTGTSAGPAAGSGTATRPRSRPCTSACTC